MSSDEPLDEEIIAEFLTEAREKTGELDSLFVRLEEDPAHGPTLSAIFRAVHTIKGNSGFFGFKTLESVAHAGENLLVKLRDGVLTATPLHIDALLKLVDVLRGLMEHIEREGRDGEDHYRSLRDTLNALAEGGADRTSTPLQSAPPQASPQLAPLPTPPLAAPPLAAAPVPAPPAPQTPGKPDDSAKNTEAQSKDLTIRVSVDLIEALMNQVGELVLARNQLLRDVSVWDRDSIERSSKQVDQITSQLQENIIKTRLQPVDGLFRGRRIMTDPFTHFVEPPGHAERWCSSTPHGRDRVR